MLSAVEGRPNEGLARWVPLALLMTCLTVIPLDVAYASPEDVTDGAPKAQCTSVLSGAGVTCGGSVNGDIATPGQSSGAESSYSSGGGGASAPVADPCTYTQIDVANSMLNADRVLSEINGTTTTTGVWYERSCPDADMDTVNWAPPPGAAPAAVLPSPQVLAQQAITSVTVTTPAVSLDPFYLLNDGRRATLKNAQTWFWVDPTLWVPLTPRVDVGPVWVEATITPHTITLTPNDGVTDPVSCAGPGTPIPAGTPMDEPSPTCSVQFTQQTDGGTWPVAVQVSYSVAWTGFDGTAPVSGTLPDLVSAPTTVPLAVLAAKPELIDANHD